MRLLTLATLLAGGLQAASLPPFFEASGTGYVASAQGRFIQISADQFQVGAGDGSGGVTLVWLDAIGNAPSGESPALDITNYLAGSDASRWRIAVPHYSRVRIADLYPHSDLAYYFERQRFEFDLVLHAGSDATRAHFAVTGARVSLGTSGTLRLDAGESRYELLAPHAYQVRNGAREAVDCRYVLMRGTSVGFEVGAYDRSRDLIIDPVVEFLTYLGGSGLDHIQAIATDPAGNVIVAGVTSSPNFPGGGTAAAGAISIFVTKLNSTGTALLFTSILGSRPNANPSVPFEFVSALAVDADGSIFVTGVTAAPNFPTTSGAWQQNSTGGFVTSLDSSGNVVYSTLLGPSVWRLTAQRLRVRNGIAYLAGTVGAAEFLGTMGAIQRNVKGLNFFALALAADGTGPRFLTAFGGSGGEALSDMTLDTAGNMVLVGTSNSPDLPLTPDALPYPAPGATGGAVLVRIDPTGSQLITSTWLGATAVSAITSVPDGGIVIAGPSVLPADLTGGAPLYSIKLSGNTSSAYIAKFPGTSNQPVWTSQLMGLGSFSGGNLSADAQGDLYWAGYPTVVSGGGMGFYSGGLGISKLAADGSRLLYASPVPVFGFGLVAAAGARGSIYFGSYTASPYLPVTPGVVQPQRDPAPFSSNPDDGFLGVLDLSSFNDSNFFAVPPQTPLQLRWRVGEPAPAAIVQPLQWSGIVSPVSATPSSRLTASYAATPSPAVTMNVNTSQTVAGTYQESVALQATANPNASLTIPVSLTLLSAVSFDLAASQVTIRFRQGQLRTPTTIAITPHLGSEHFSYSVASTVTGVYGYVTSSDPQHPVLSINVADQAPGTYDGTLTISLQGLQNASRVLQVHYVVDPPASIQLSSRLVKLHVVKGQPVTPAVLTVTGSVPGVQWRIFVGVSRTWLHVTQTTTSTPGQIQITVDPDAEVGYWSFVVSVYGETDQTGADILVDISSGAPLDAVPGSLSYQYTRGGAYAFQYQLVSFTAPSPTTVRWSADQPWITPATGTLTTPGVMSFAFDTTLPEGVYQGKITLTTGSASVVIPVTWMLYDAPHLVFSTNPINFQWTVGDPPPPPQQLQITCPTLKPDAFQVGATTFPTFLKIDPQFGSTPATLTLSADPTGYAPGTYTVNLAIGSFYPDTKTYPAIPVTLTVLPNPNAPKATIARVVDAASFLGGAVSPGEAVVIFGSGLGPPALTPAQPGADGRFPSTLAGWTFSFDGVPAPVLYLSDKQSAVIAPFAIAGRLSTSVTVATGGTTSLPVAITVSAANPSVFTANSSGSGLAAAVNVASDGSITQNSSATPVAPGGVVTFYAGGLGITMPIMPDGSLAGAPLPQLNSSVRVLVGGQQADLLYAGPAPGLVAGLTQINIRIPANSSSGLLPLLVIAGDLPSQPGVTLTIQ